MGHNIPVNLRSESRLLCIAVVNTYPIITAVKQQSNRKIKEEHDAKGLKRGMFVFI